MKTNQIWKQIVKLFLFLEESKKHKLEENIQDANKIIDFRSDLRNKISDIQDLSLKILGTKLSYYLIFPIVVYCDEILSNYFAYKGVDWPKMQLEIYNLEDGGERFFEITEQIIENPIYPEIIYQLYYMILKTQYKGKLIDAIKKDRQYYLKKIEEILKVKSANSKIVSTFTTRKKKYNRKEYILSLLSNYFYIPCFTLLLIIYLISFIWIKQ